jgi:hypothetical protein
VNQYLLQRRTSLDLVVNEQWTPSLRGVWGGEIWHESVKSPQNYYGSGDPERHGVADARQPGMARA